MYAYILTYIHAYVHSACVHWQQAREETRVAAGSRRNTVSQSAVLRVTKAAN
jgi:hypothetical protein